jgi:NodT family efflux transporter outer membrane factor (OMF) lipoprotein
MKPAVWVALTGVLTLGGCDLAPPYQTPSVALPEVYKDGAAGGAALDGDQTWWRSFRDRRLDELEAQVDAANPDLAAALAAYDASRARVVEATAGLYPEIDAGAGLSENKQSNDRPLRSSTQPNYYGANQLAAQSVYELDVWGRVRDILKAANASAEASADALADARLELHAELARDYVDLRGLDQERKLLADTVSIYRSALELTKSRLAANVASPVDVERAQTQLSGLEAQQSDLELRRGKLEDAIAALVGDAAANFKLANDPRPLATPTRPRTVPGDVLRRRPDVALNERLVAVASAEVGVATASLYPRFTIGLLGGTQDTGLNLLSLTNSMYTVGPSVSLPLFDAGLRGAQIDEAKARLSVATANYRSSVLRAVKEVEDNLSALRWLAQEARQTATAATAAGEAAKASMTLYVDGAASFLDVVTAQTAALDAQRATIALHTRELEANVALLLALGGGWSVTEDTAPSQ